MKTLLTRIALWVVMPLAMLSVGGHAAAVNSHQPLTGCLADTAVEVAEQIGVEGATFVGAYDNPDGTAWVVSNRPTEVVLDLADVEPWCGVPVYDEALRETIAHELAHVAQYRLAGATDARWGGALKSVPAVLVSLPRLQDRLAENMPAHLEGIDALEASADCANEYLGMRVTPGYGNECTPAMLADAAWTLEAGGPV